MHNDKESPFTLTLLDDNLSLQVLQFSGREALNQPYRFDIEAIGLAPAIPVEQLLQQPARLDMGHGQCIHGVLHCASREQRQQHPDGCKLVLVPALQALDRYRSRRIFQRLSVPMILRQLLEEQGLPDSSYRFELENGHYPLRTFCIQYEETDLALLQRLCEEEGIHYHFEHHHSGHVLVLADDSLSFPQQPLLMPFNIDTPASDPAPVISELFQRYDSRPLRSRMGARDRGKQAGDDGAANQAFHCAAVPMQRPTHEQRYRDQLGRRQLERLRCQQVQIHGQSNHRGLRSAGIVQVAEHPLPELNNQWLVIQTRHQGQQDSPGLAPRYHNQFSAIPWSTVFRPALKQTRPSIPGFQPAKVCGPAGQPAAQDDQGQIQVSLWPGSNAACEESAGLWLPVALTASNAGLDPSGLPMAGTAGLVSFLDSDPDRPVFCPGSGPRHTTPPMRTHLPRNDTRLLLDWLSTPVDREP
ncbi:MAG: type VI secretion system Vgr family protein [Pseudomonas sp.]|uniref:type VI secretion system Vgr family protein n=1 Tax=Pseudomonas sp. TaxID=306 RepID=UPI003D6E8B81